MTPASMLLVTKMSNNKTRMNCYTSENVFLHMHNNKHMNYDLCV